MQIINGFWWFGGNRNLEFELTKFGLEKLEDLKLIFKKNQGAILNFIDLGVLVKKEAGSYNFFIKTQKKGWKRLKTNNLRKIISTAKLGCGC